MGGGRWPVAGRGAYHTREKLVKAFQTVLYAFTGNYQPLMGFYVLTHNSRDLFYNFSFEFSDPGV